MINDANPALAAILVPALAAWIAIAAPAPARSADLDLPGGCAIAGSASLHEGSGSFDAGRLEVTVPGAGSSNPTSFHAARLRADARGAASVGPAQLEQASTAAAAALLTALLSARSGACSDAVLQRAMQPLAHGVQTGGSYDFTWTDVAVRAGNTRFGAHHLALHVGGDGRTAHLTGTLDGAASNNRAAGLLPESLDVRVALPADELPALLSATGGHGAPVDVTIEHAVARRGGSTLSGHGQASIASTPDASSGQGQLTAQGFDQLIEAANAPGMERLRTGLFLAKLVAHRQGDQSDWDLAWQQGTLMVNNVPLPLH